MESKIFIFSNKVLSGEYNFDFEKLNKICTHFLIKIGGLSVQKYDLQEIENEENLLVFCDNENLDNLIIKNMHLLGENKKIFNDQIAIFEKNNKKVIFSPTEIDLNNFCEIFSSFNLNLRHYKLFGINEKDLIEKLKNFSDEKFDYKFLLKDLICDITVTFGEDNLINDDLIKFNEIFKPYIFSENDMTLEKIVLSLLKVKNKTLAICENVTKGELDKGLLQEGDTQEIKVLSHQDFSCENKEMLVDKAMKFLSSSDSNLALIACKKVSEEGQDIYFALADKTDVHIYKNHFSSSEKVEKSIKNIMLFQIVKKLRQNDFAF